jgi:hypothetical protein
LIGYDRQSELGTVLPASFSPGLFDLQWSTDDSWETPWGLPTLRSLAKVKLAWPWTLTTCSGR